MKYIVANWKANMSYGDVQQWIHGFSENLEKNTDLQSLLFQQKLKVIFAPSFPFLGMFQDLKKQFPYLGLSSQTVSDRAEGSFTGEVVGKNLEGLVEYSLIGHSERRVLYCETQEQILQKVKMALTYNIAPIVCIRDETDFNRDFDFVAYEPVGSVDTGKNLEADLVVDFKNRISFPSQSIFLYGGSVTLESAQSYLKKPEIDGLLIGKSSLNQTEFFTIITQVL